MTKKQKKMLKRIIIASVLMIVLAFLPVTGILKFALYMVPYLVIGHDILRKAFLGVKNKQMFDESFLMAVATVGAIILGEYTEGVAVMLFFQIGEWFQSYAVGKSRRNISQLMDIRPDYANIEDENGNLEQVDPDEVAVGTVIVVQPGEKVPIDGVILEGSSTLNTAALTGESLPRDVVEGDEIISGCINMTGLLKIRTTKEFGESTVSKILDLVENASSRKSRSENFISRFAYYYTPIVCYSALALALIPPVVLMFMGMPSNWGSWIYRALTFLVISCPCALVISIPLTFFGGIGAASKHGVLVKGSNYLETLNNVSTVVFDKTGTLTKGVFKVTEILPDNGFTVERILEYGAKAEIYSNHPIAKSIIAAYEKDVDETNITDHKEISGYGISVTADNKNILAGNSKLMDTECIHYKPCDKAGTKVYIAVDGKYAGCILIADEIKEDSKRAIAELKRIGIEKTVMLTGDDEMIGKAVSQELGLDEYYAQLLPDQKVEKVELLESQKPLKSKLAFVGDGINDAPVLARADVGIAMGGVGSDAAIEAADVVLMTDEPSKLVEAIEVAKATKRIVVQNIVLALTVKVMFMVLGAFGIAGMWEAVFGDVGVALIAVMNAMRTLKK